MKALSLILGAAAYTGLLASCGGGGGGAAPVAADSVQLNCKVVDKATGNAVAGADVNYQSGNTAYTTATAADGTCSLNLPAADVAGTAFPAATVSKPGYEPQTLLYPTLQGGQSYTQQEVLVPLAANVLIPSGGDMVWHLGNGDAEGSVNSQFQKATDGLEKSFVVDDWAAKMKAGYTKATVYVDAKGWQSDICLNQIGIAGDVGTVMLTGGISPANGSWGGGRQVPFVFPIDQIGRLRAEVRFTSGVCNDTPDDLDDFEINRLRVELS
jgi:hypothetical protein